VGWPVARRLRRGSVPDAAVPDRTDVVAVSVTVTDDQDQRGGFVADRFK